MQGLTVQQIDQFHREGYLMVPDVFDPGNLEPVREELAAVVDREARLAYDAGLLPDLYAAEPLETRLTHICRHTDAVYKGVMGRGGGGHAGEELFNVITHPKLLARVEALVGPEIVGSSVYRIRPKVPGWPHGVVAWHQDSGYFAPHCDERLILTCWMPLVDATVENGCLYVLPRTHLRGVYRHHTGGYAGYLVITDADLPDGAAVPVPVPRGGVLFLTNLTPHCSKENSTDGVRWSLDLRYQDARVPNNAGQMPEAFDAATLPHEMACYPPEADFVIQSAAHPERVIADWKQFEALRRAYDAARHLPYPKRGWQPVRE
jgi:phytanoyl-CoA hydroxylase